MDKDDKSAFVSLPKEQTDDLISNWRKVPGDIDDFIFSMEEKIQSERKNQSH